MNSHKLYITDEEYDELSWYEERNYYWCPECEHYYNKELLTQGCEHGAQGGCTYE